MDLGLKNKTALVTGGSRGLGRYCAMALTREGANVAICARTQDNLDKTVAELKTYGGQAAGIVADVTKPQDAARLYDEVVRLLGPVDILVNNVGGGKGGEFSETTEQHLKDALDVNIFGAFRLIKLVAPHMQQQKWGRIINIASIWGREYGGRLAYMTGKSALIGFTKHLSRSLAKDGVLVNSVAPGSTDFPGGSWERFQKQNPPDVVKEFVKNELPMGQFGKPEPIADLVAFLASERASTITGSCIVVDAGQSRSLF